jgi:hypothetical protein
VTKPDCHDANSATRSRTIAWLIVSLICISLPEHAFSQQQAPFPCRDDDKECAAKTLGGHAVTRLDYWKAAFGKPVEQRFGAASPDLVEYLALDNIKSGFPNKPRPAALPPDFLRDVRTAIAEMPVQVRRLLTARLAGIYFVEDLGGTGYTEEILDSRSRPKAGFVVLDTSVLGKNANEWATWKENTPFRARPDIRLTAEIEQEGQNNRKNAIQYILLHEFGHVVAIGEKFHPSWNTDPKDIKSTAGYPFSRLSWSVSRNEDRFVSIFDEAFPQRRDVVYYLEAKLPAEQMVRTYGNLERTNFATLYSVTNPADDFAEAFANYVHTVSMKKPFEIRIFEGGTSAKAYSSCWTRPRCAQKKRILENYLNRK